MPEIHQMKNPVKTAVSSTPNVERTIPGTRIGLISLNFSIHTAGKQNNAKSNHTNKLCFFSVMKL